MIKLSFQPKQVTKKLVKILPERSQDVITKRYGLGLSSDTLTLEAIGKEYGITRERVRQIEENSLATLRKSDDFKKSQEIFTELHSIITDLGSVISEEELLDHLSKNESVRNHVHFLLVLGNEFKKMKEDDHFKHRWHVDGAVADKIEGAIKSLYKSLSKDTLISDSEIIESFIANAPDLASKHKREEIIRRWLNISKRIGRNPLGEWGRAESPNINVKGIRDYAFLVIRRHGSPIHFREVAEQINKLFDKKAHVATCHNELIKDPRFVLVGRGLYALTDWGYASGVVRDVINKLIEKHGPLTKEEIITKVLKERYVKENTILVNLQNQKYFKKDKQGRYAIA
jgi:DNA-binding winged helix-turn-helix (wHTH) protein